MSCITRHQASHQLLCNFPAPLTIISAIAVYFTPDPGSERRVVNCVLLEDLECAYESGFKCEVLTSKYAEITVPESVQNISGTFRCQTPGFSTADIRSCHWPPAVTQIPDEILQTTATFSTSQYNEGFTNQAENKVIAIALIVSGAVVLAVLFTLVVAIMLLRKRMRMGYVKKHRRPTPLSLEASTRIDASERLRNRQQMIRLQDYIIVLQDEESEDGQ